MTPREQGLSVARGRLALLLLCIGLCLTGCQTETIFRPERIASEQDAQGEFDAGAGRAPTPRTLYATARLLAAQRRDNQCEALLTRIIREHPTFMPAYCDLAELRVRQRRIDEAIATLQAAAKQSPEDPVILNNLGMCAMLSGDHQEALDLFTRASAIAPDNARYRANMAAALGMMGRYEEALALYRQAIPERDAQHNIGVLHRARANYLAGNQPRQDATFNQPPAGLLPQTQPAVR